MDSLQTVWAPPVQVGLVATLIPSVVALQKPWVSTDTRGTRLRVSGLSGVGRTPWSADVAKSTLLASAAPESSDWAPGSGEEEPVQAQGAWMGVLYTEAPHEYFI